MAHDSQTNVWSPFLTDFDLAWFSTASQIFTKEGMGSIYYASPEQYATPSAASAHAPTTDIYSFGQLAFFVATGSDPVPLGVADNIRALRGRLTGGWFSDAAENFLKLYQDCTQPKPERRTQEFSEICDRLFRIKQSLSAVSSATTLSDEQFVREVIFSMVGLSSGSPEPCSFLTVSRKTRVAIEVSNSGRRSVDVHFDFQSQEAPVIEGVNTFEQLRKILFGRIDVTLERFAGARKRRGTALPFQVFVDLDNVPLDLEGVANSRSLISRVLDALEGH